MRKITVATADLLYDDNYTYDISPVHWGDKKPPARLFAGVQKLEDMKAEGFITVERYAELYRAYIAKQFSTYPHKFKLFIKQTPSIVMACGCTDHTTCHRHLAAEFFVKIAESYGFEAEYTGEIQRMF